jgi:hypothetical protein
MSWIMVCVISVHSFSGNLYCQWSHAIGKESHHLFSIFFEEAFHGVKVLFIMYLGVLHLGYSDCTFFFNVPVGNVHNPVSLLVNGRFDSVGYQEVNNSTFRFRYFHAGGIYV